MDLLIIGGTVFLGRHLMDAALEGGHRVTIFHRGKHEAELDPRVEEIHGDRERDLDRLRGRRWDAAIDTCGYVPGVVRASAEFLADQVAHYVFVSSISVYSDLSKPGLDESTSVGTITPEQVASAEGVNFTDVRMAASVAELYGPLKALCERAAEAAMPGRVVVVRPGLIVGPHDYTDRFGYWVRRVAEGGEVLAPGRPERPIQIIDARDLAEWMIRLSERRATGVIHVTGPDRELTMGEMLDTCREVGRSDASFTWVGEEFLGEKKVAPWSELPLWIPESNREMEGFMRVGLGRALESGLTFRPLADTAASVLAWERSRPASVERVAGISRERERELLEEWKRVAV